MAAVRGGLYDEIPSHEHRNIDGYSKHGGETLTWAFAQSSWIICVGDLEAHASSRSNGWSITLSERRS